MTRLNAEQQAWAEAAWKLITPERLTELVVGMVDIPSPTGEEAELARWLTETLTHAGLDAHYQAIDDRQANAVGRLRGTAAATTCCSTHRSTP